MLCYFEAAISVVVCFLLFVLVLIFRSAAYGTSASRVHARRHATPTAAVVSGVLDMAQIETGEIALARARDPVAPSRGDRMSALCARVDI